MEDQENSHFKKNAKATEGVQEFGYGPVQNSWNNLVRNVKS